MSNSKKRYLLVSLICLIAGAVYYLNRISNVTTLTSKSVNPPIKKIETQKNSPEHVVAKIVPMAELSEFKNISEIEKKSLVTLTSLIDETLTNPSSMNFMIQKLDQLNLKPLVMKESNPQTGSLDIIRTKETLPGTRYFHAQYFANDDGSNFLQHVSFEFKGSNDSFDLVKKVIQKQFGITKAPVMENKKFISWNIDGRSVWIKKMDQVDLAKKSPFNAYDIKNDIGTIRFGSEAEVH